VCYGDVVQFCATAVMLSRDQQCYCTVLGISLCVVTAVLLCGCPTRLAHPSVCPTQACETQKQKIGVNAPHGTSKWIAIFQLKRSKVKVTGREKTGEIATCLAYVYLLAAAPAAQAPTAY